MKKSCDAVSLVMLEHKKGYQKRIFDTVGLMLRCVLALACAYGLLSFLADSFAVPVSYGWLFFVCLSLCTLFSFMVLYWKIAVCGGVLLAAVGAFCFFSAEAPVKTVSTTFTLFRNLWYSRLCTLGYGYEYAITDVGDTVALLGYSQEQLYVTGVFFAALILCAVTVLFTVRRARFLPTVSVCALVSTGILYFGAGENLFAFGLVISSLFGVAALSCYDGVFVNKKNVMDALGTDSRSPGAKLELSHALRQNISSGGYVGGAALLIALVLCVVPMQLKASMRDISFISNPIMRLENYISAIADGKTPGHAGFLSLFGDELDRHSTEAKKRRQSGEALLLVNSDTSVPVYLRAWTGVDYKDDAWYTASYSREADFRETFGEDFSSEELFYDMRCTLDPALKKAPNKAEVISNIPLGYVSSRVNIKKLKARGVDTVLPAATRRDEGIFEYGKDTTHAGDVQNYYDGVIIDTKSGSLDSYGVIADIALAPDSTLAYNISVFVKYYSEQYAFIKEAYKKLENGAGEEQIRAFFNTSYKEEDIVYDAYEALPTSYHFPEPEQSLAYRYVYEMDSEEREAVNALIEKLATYNEYVYLNYTTLCENHEAFEALMEAIAEENGISFRQDAATYGGRHRSVAAVIDYLSSNMTYTIEPKARDRQREYYNGAETFLFDTKEGYCVQYATSAVMLLRSVGIPARYVEGYIAKDFVPSANGVSNYTCTVTDYNAHAWIEVYFDYFGWVRYEATAPYIKEGGLPAVGEVGEETDLPPETDGDIPEIPDQSGTDSISGDTEKPSSNTASKEGVGGAVAAIIFSVVVLVGLTLAVVTLKERAVRTHKEMKRLINSTKRNLTREERIAAARKMGDITEKLLRRKDLVPMPSETSTQFIRRVDKHLLSDVKISFEAAMRAIQAGEFAKDVSPDTLSELAEYLEVLYEASVKNSGFFGYIITKYFTL